MPMLWMPPGGVTNTFVIRRAEQRDASAIAEVYVRCWRETYKGLLPASYLSSLSVARYESQWRKTLASRGWAFVCEDLSCVDPIIGSGSKIVGVVSGGPARKIRYAQTQEMGEIYILYLLHRYHGKGVGRALFDACQYELNRRGLGALVVWVLEDNPATGFYETLGGSSIEQSEIMLGDQCFNEIAYHWPA